MQQFYDTYPIPNQLRADGPLRQVSSTVGTASPAAPRPGPCTPAADRPAAALDPAATTLDTDSPGIT